MSIKIQHKEGIEFLEEVEDGSVDLVLTDPPYITSRKTGMDKWVDFVKKVKGSGENVKTEEEWEEWYKNTSIDFYVKKEVEEVEEVDEAVEQECNETTVEEPDEVIEEEPKIDEKKVKKAKENFLKYGTIYGEKYAVKTDYGEWDSEFTMEKMKLFINHYYRALRKGGTAIIFFDIWKITPLKELMEEAGFKQIRFIEWIKTNPQPLNSGRNYLTNCREIALLGVKYGSPTFNSKYDNAIYEFPIQGGGKKERFHPTQKSLPLFEALIEKHSNEGDLVLDSFSGSGTTAIASMKTKRNFVGCELDKDFYDKSIERLKAHENKEEK